MGDLLASIILALLPGAWRLPGYGGPVSRKRREAHVYGAGEPSVARERVSS
jgi:hypothetical protein